MLSWERYSASSEGGAFDCSVDICKKGFFLKHATQNFSDVSAHKVLRPSLRLYGADTWPTASPLVTSFLRAFIICLSCGR